MHGSDELGVLDEMVHDEASQLGAQLGVAVRGEKRALLLLADAWLKGVQGVRQI